MVVRVVEAGSRRRRRKPVLTDIGSVMLHSVIRVVLVVAVAVVIGAGFIVFSVAQTPNDSSGQPVDTSVPLLVLVGAGSVAVAAAIVSARIARRRRGMVLYLRRFRYAQGLEAVTSAVVGSLGRAWRLVTLDDAQSIPVGISSRTHRARTGLRAVGAVGGAVIRVPASIAYAVFLGSFWAAVVLLGYEYLQHRDLSVLGPYRHQAAYGGAASLMKPLLVALLTSGLVLVLLMLVQAGMLMVTSLPAAYLASVERTVRLMDTAKEDGIRVHTDISRLVTQIGARSHRGSSARLWVVKVHSPLWQEAVLRLARHSQRILVDVSEASDNVIWELEHLTAPAGARCVLIGSRERVSWLAGAHAEDLSSELDRRFLRALDGHTILAYGADDAAFCLDLADALRWGL